MSHPAPSLRWRALVVVVAAPLGGCTDPARGGDTSTPAAEDTASMVYSTDDPEPVWSAQDFQEILARVLGRGTPSPAIISDAYVQIMAQGDEDCPGGGTDMQTDPEGCEADSGYRYAGIAWFNYAVPQEINGVEVAMNYSHGGDFEILTPEGERFAGAGGIAYLSELKDGVVTIGKVDIHGSWIATYRQDWLGDGFSGVYTVSLTTDMASTFDFVLDGGISVGDVDMYFESATWDTSDGCEGSFTGALSLRDDRGYWTRWEVTDACSVCGELVFHGDQSLGEMCLDINGWGHEMAVQMSPPPTSTFDTDTPSTG